MRLLHLVACAATALAIDCSAKELSAYGFSAIKGVYSASSSRNTPPSVSTFTWNVGICQNLDELSDCPKNSDVCGLTRVKVDDKELLTEAIGFNANLQKSYDPFTDEGDDKISGIDITYTGATWGDSLVDASIRFICVKPGSAKENELEFVSWNGDKFKGQMKTSAACANSKGGSKPAKPPSGDNGESWGWFTWIFIFVVLFLSIYIIGGAWFQYNKGNSIDFQSALREVLENFVDLLRGLPQFVKEIVEKVTGNSNRGEYSAV